LFQVGPFIINFYIDVEQTSHTKLLKTTTPTLLHMDEHKPSSYTFKIIPTIVIILFEIIHRFFVIFKLLIFILFFLSWLMPILLIELLILKNFKVFYKYFFGVFSTIGQVSKILSSITSVSSRYLYLNPSRYHFEWYFNWKPNHQFSLMWKLDGDDNIEEYIYEIINTYLGQVFKVQCTRFNA
jgi:hypothetical protein